MPPWGVSRDGSEPLPLGHRFSIFRFLPSPSSLMAINPHSSFSQWSIAYSVGPHLKTSYIPLSTNRFPIRVVPRFSRDPCRKPVSRFAATQPDQTVPSPNSQNKRRSRRSDEGTSAGYATALPLLCAPYRRSPERNNDTSLIPQTIYWPTKSYLHCIPFVWPEGGNGTSMETPKRISPNSAGTEIV